MRKVLFAALATAIITVFGLTAPAQAATHHHHSKKAVVSILHAVPGVPVDVYLNHKRILDNFQPGTLAGPLKVKPGKYTVTIAAANATNDKNPIIGPVKVHLKAKRNYTIVAHLSAKGTPTATLYNNSLKRPHKGKGRLIVRHVAAAPGVDVFANGKLSMRNLKNPHQSKTQVKVGTYTLAVAVHRTTAPVIGPADVKVKTRQDTIVYAWGSAQQGNLTVAVQTVTTH